MKFLKKLSLALVCALVCFGFACPIVASAEEVAETPVIEQETQEVEEVVEETQDVENTQENEAILESEENTFENFLAWVGKEAERYGYGEEYAKALELIKTAATTKQVTVATVVNSALWLLGICYIVYKKCADKRNIAKVGELSSQVGAQLKKLDELVDATNENSKSEETIKHETEELKKEMKTTITALQCFVGGFMHFAEGVKMQDTKKDEVLRDCNNALHLIDGVCKNEDNER